MHSLRATTDRVRTDKELTSQAHKLLQRDRALERLAK